MAQPIDKRFRKPYNRGGGCPSGRRENIIGVKNIFKSSLKDKQQEKRQSSITIKKSNDVVAIEFKLHWKQRQTSTTKNTNETSSGERLLALETKSIRRSP